MLITLSELIHKLDPVSQLQHQGHYEYDLESFLGTLLLCYPPLSWIFPQKEVAWRVQGRCPLLYFFFFLPGFRSKAQLRILRVIFCWEWTQQVKHFFLYAEDLGSISSTTCLWALLRVAYLKKSQQHPSLIISHQLHHTFWAMILWKKK